MSDEFRIEIDQSVLDEAGKNPMAFRDALVYEMAGLQQSMNAAREKQLAFLGHFCGGELPPLSRREKVRHWFSWRLRAVRERVARRIAPWLDEY